MKTKSLGFIGGGRITKILLQGFNNAGLEFESVKVFDPNAGLVGKLAADFPAVEKVEAAEAAASQQIVFLAVHPPVMMETLQRISGVVSENTTVVSLAPKITLEKMAGVLPTKKLVRMIPNATSFVNEGFNPVTFSEGFNPDEKRELMEILNLLGKTFEVDEPKLEAYAILSAMLPTYFWFQWNELGKLGTQMGLTEKETLKAIRATLKKSIKLYYKSSLTPEEVIDLIPVKPIGEYEGQITEMYRTKLPGLFEKIKP